MLLRRRRLYCVSVLRVHSFRIQDSGFLCSKINVAAMPKHLEWRPMGGVKAKPDAFYT
jgi:hypothetical protein